MQSATMLRDGNFKSVREAIDRMVQFFADAPILAELNEDKELVYTTGRQLYDEMMALGEGLIRDGLKDAHIAIVAENSVRYFITDMTVSCGVGVVTPIDVNASAELLSELLHKCDAGAVMCSSFCVDKVRAAGLDRIITMDRRVEGVKYYDDILELGRVPEEESIYRNLSIDVNAPAKILFTSGTTGANKGVVLTNANLTANILNCMDVIKAVPGNTSMSVLPMHHATEINTHILTRVMSGRLTYINGNMKSMMTNIKIFKPNIITIVPMIVNAFYRNIMAGVRKAGKEEKLKKGIRISNFLRRLGIDRTHKLFAEVLAPFGGNLDMIVSGGSMLNPMVIKGLNDLGIRVENGYGITECGPLVSMNSDTLDDYLSVGTACPALECKILNPDEDGVGELCVRGASVSSGYYKDEEATRQVFYEDGFFNTGDSAKMGKDGRITLVGRKKNTIVLESGKNICPEEIENIIGNHLDYADDIVVYRANFNNGNLSHPVLCAGLYIKDETLRSDRDAILKAMKTVNASLPPFKQIEYVELPSVEYPKTSSRKIVRKGLPESCSGQGLII